MPGQIHYCDGLQHLCVRPDRSAPGGQRPAAQTHQRRAPHRVHQPDRGAGVLLQLAGQRDPALYRRTPGGEPDPGEHFPEVLYQRLPPVPPVQKAYGHVLRGVRPLAADRAGQGADAEQQQEHQGDLGADRVPQPQQFLHPLQKAHRHDAQGLYDAGQEAPRRLRVGKVSSDFAHFFSNLMNMHPGGIGTIPQQDRSFSAAQRQRK